MLLYLHRIKHTTEKTAWQFTYLEASSPPRQPISAVEISGSRAPGVQSEFPPCRPLCAFARSSCCCCLLPCCRLLVSISPSVDVIGIKAARLSPSVSSSLLPVPSARPRPTQGGSEEKNLTEAAIHGPSPCIVPPIRALTLTVLFYGLGRRPLARSSWPWHPVPRAEQLPLQRVHHVHNAPSAGRCPLASRNQPSIQQIANCKRGARFRPHSVSRRWH